MSTRPYRLLGGAIWAFLLVGLFVKLAELLLTYEHRLLLSWDDTLARRIGQVWFLLRFSWQEFAIAGGLFGALAAFERWVPEPGRAARTGAASLRILLGVTSLLSVCGIAYYAFYQSHLVLEDIVDYAIWARHLAADGGPLTFTSVRLGLGVWVLLTLGLPWVMARAAGTRTQPSALVSCALLCVVAVGMFAVGRPNVGEARLEPNPVGWLLFGRRVSYADLPPIRSVAPVGKRDRLLDLRERPRNVVHVILEAVPAEALVMFDASATGGRRLMEELGDEVTVFDQVFTPTPDSVAALFSVWTGLTPTPNAVAALKALGELPTLPQLLKERGYHTQFLLNGPTNWIIDDLAGRGFDHSMDMSDQWPNQERYARATWGYDDRLLFDHALAEIRNRPADAPPFFMTLHTNNPHYPYASDLIEGLGTSSDSKVRHRLLVRHLMDALTDFYRGLKASGLAESTVVIAHADHGEAFGEHSGNFIHAKELYRGNVHVPMLLLHPRRLGLPPRIHQLGSLVDVPATILDILGMPAPERDGMSLLSEAPDRLVFSMTNWGPGQVALRDRQYLYVLSRTGRELLFDRNADPHERTNLVTERPDVAAAFKARFSAK